MTLLRVIQCDGSCSAWLAFEGRPTQSDMISHARSQRWTVTVDGRHYCCSCQETRRSSHVSYRRYDKRRNES